MYQCILFIILFFSEPFQYKCEIQDLKIYLQAIIMPFDKLRHTKNNQVNETTGTENNSIQNEQNIKAKTLHMTINLKRNRQEFFTNDEVITIDKVYDAVTDKESKLINPYIVVIQQDEVLEKYKLKHLKEVNAEAKEQVFNKDSSSHYLGCFADLKQSCCNPIMVNNNPVKYSEGFCCSCKMSTNVERQLNDCEGRSRFKHVIHTTNNYRQEFDMVIDQLVDNITSNNKNKNKTADLSNNKQIRGGQNCDDIRTPEYVNEPYRYHESSHCLQFSDLWYDVNQLESASYYHSVTMSVYEKYTRNEKPAYKQIISKVKLNSDEKNVKNCDSTVEADYVALKFGDDQYYSLDIDRDRLLIPGKVSSVVEHIYPQATDDPKKYLIVNANNISIKGDECDKVGVSYEAFYKQFNRCGEPRSSCLKNQPSDLWRHDMDAINSGNPGNYFLENFAKFPQKTEIIKEIDGTKTLNLLYEMDYTSELLIHTTTNYNCVHSTRSLLEIVEVYSDATKSDLTTISADVYNIGMKANFFRIQLLTQSPLNTANNWTTVQSIEKEIFPFHRNNYVINVYGFLDPSYINCTLQVLDKSDNIVAWREVLISEANRCFCVWECECSCTTIEPKSFTSKCKSMPRQEFNKAGFRGVLPLNFSHNSKTNIVQLTLIFIVILWSIVFLIGITKAIIGLCFKPISSFKLHLIFDEKSKNLKCYLEPGLYIENVIYDNNGHAVHPKTNLPTIQLVSKKKEFIANMFYLALILVSFMKKCYFMRMFKNIRNKTHEVSINSEEKTETEDDDTLGCDNDTSSLSDDSEKTHKKMESNDEFDDKIDYSRPPSVKSTAGSLEYNDNNERLSNRTICLQKEMTKTFVQKLLSTDVVYINEISYKYSMMLKKKKKFSIAGYFVKDSCNFYFHPSPLEQTCSFDGTLLKKPKKLCDNKYYKVYSSEEEVIKRKELSLTPRGNVINK